MSTPVSKLPSASQRFRRQFNLRTLFEFVTGVCILTPAFQYAQRDSSSDTLAWILLLFACGLTMLGACWLFVLHCPANRAGSLLAVLFSMSMFDGFLLGGFALFQEVDQATAVGITVIRFALMWIVGSQLSFLYACMISLALLIPALLAALVVRARFPRATQPIAGLLIGAMTGDVVGLGWAICLPVTGQASPIFQMLLATAYGGYFGGRLIEQSRGNVSAALAEMPLT